MATLPVPPPALPPKLVATDLDGTLLRSDGTLSSRTRAALAAAEGAGIRVVLVTGRPPRSVPALLESTGPHVVIAANGAAVHAPSGAVAQTSPIPRLTAARLVENLRAAIPGVSFAVEYDAAHGHETTYPSWSFQDGSVELVGAAEDILAESPGRPLLKVLAHHPTLPLDDFYARARRIAGTSAETTHSTGMSLVEFSAPRVTKATTLIAWSGRLGIGSYEIAAFGDMPNDLPMLNAVGSSYAMANAHPDVLAAARHHAPSNDEDGVAQVLEGFVDTLAHRTPWWAPVLRAGEGSAEGTL
ncbi:MULTISPECIES: HAD family hydrolase [unclassified Streptomyces]|uniref:HAD family hydrolase n=1 Tax=unclassified Streptomyces TaxID=2593676 RepID=UPI001661FC83|nr:MULTISPECIES: HAD family hydrolase [unclassified Streptomyces]MBD0839496.1 HAD-IIB family hydrolase [Streptomyces sp. TRM68416]